MTETPNEITPDELRKKLERHEPLTIVDVRTPAEHDEWSIPGSLVKDAHDPLWAGDPTAMDGLDLPKDRPVLTVCNRGRTSLLARAQLEAKGYHAISLTGGMKAWSLMWNKAIVPISEKGGVTVIQFRRTGKGCLSYLVGSNGQAVVIDPSLDADIYRKEAADRGWRITASLDTHIHADHLTRARKIAALTGSEVRLPETTRATFPYHPIRDSEAVEVGDVDLTAMRSPGHTPESVCYRLDNRALFTGDTMFVQGVGRPDLEATASGANKRAHALFRSIQHLISLPGELLVLPAHTGKPVPFDGTPIMATLADVRARIGEMPPDENGFVDWVMSRIPPLPPNHHEIVKMNEKGIFPEGDPTDLEAGANRCAVG